ncbi:MAG TPA: cytochrome C oxidase subunit IV family protein [Bryobacteraceae bacterium]|nr:cytochrome C oxidase subunit IV family protein [Bryobacteraceae bacterium]
MNEHPHQDPEHAEHIDSVKTYAVILVALLCLTILTAFVATIDLGPLNIIVALSIAVAKMLLVVLVFMHVRFSTRLTRVVLVGGLLWLAILLLFAFTDFNTRGLLGVPGK